MYLIPICSAPLYLVRCPDSLPWRTGVLRGLTAVMRHYGFRQKDISSIDGYSGDDPECVSMRAKLDTVYATGEGFDPFDLWDWIDGAFVLVRSRK